MVKVKLKFFSPFLSGSIPDSYQSPDWSRSVGGDQVFLPL